MRQKALVLMIVIATTLLSSVALIDSEDSSAFTFNYTLIYNANGGTGTPPSQTDSNTVGQCTFYIPHIEPTRDGYVFAGWDSQQRQPDEVTSGIYYPGDFITIHATSTDVTKELYAVWVTGYTYKLYYSSESDTVNKPSTMTYGPTTEQSHTFTVSSTIPTRPAYDFQYWYIGSNHYQGGDTVTCQYNDPNKILAASWTPKQFTVSFNANGGTVSPVSKNVTYNSQYGQLPTPTREGYMFTGWYTEATNGNEVTSTSVYSITENQTLYAHWAQSRDVTPTNSAIAAKLSYLSKGSYITETYAEVKYVNWQLDIWTERTLSYGASIDTSVMASMSSEFGYNPSAFQGIDRTSSSQNNSAISNAGISISYGYNASAFRYQYIEVSGTGLSNLGDHSYSNTYTNNYQNNRWVITTTDGMGQAAKNFITIIVHVQPLTYTLTYNTNGGTFSSTPQTTFNEGTVVTLSTDISRQDYTFMGWQDGLNMPVTQVTMNSNKTVNATWQYNYTTLTYNANGGTFSDTPQTVYLRGSTAILDNNITRPGYTFGGWTLNNSVVTQVDMSTDRTVSAIWNPNEYTVTFNANGGTVNPSMQTVRYGEMYGIMPIPSQLGYNFKGWYTDATNGTLVSASSIYSIIGNQTLYAQWTDSATYWSNGNPNGSVSILYHIDNTTAVNDIISKFVLYRYDANIQDDPSTQFNESFVNTGYYINIEIKSVPLGVNNYDAQAIIGVYDSSNNLIASDVYSFGSWSAFIITVDTLNASVNYTKVMQFRTFTDYQESVSGTILSYADEGDFTNLSTYEMKMIPVSDAIPRQSIVRTSVFLNTYGVVYIDPSIDIESYFPNMPELRLNFFSFALYGDSMTVNGHTMDVSGPNITINYTTSNGQNYISDTTGNGIQTKTLELTNIYITWDTSNCILTFANEDFSINMGSYTDKMVSFSGIWYYATSLYEPYTATETVYELDWWHTHFDMSTFGIVLAGLLLVFAAIAKATIGGRTIDFVIVGAGVIVAIILAGGVINA